MCITVHPYADYNKALVKFARSVQILQINRDDITFRKSMPKVRIELTKEQEGKNMKRTALYKTMIAAGMAASMLVGTAGCYATDKPNMTSFSQTESVTEASSEDTQAVTEATKPVVVDSGVDYLEGYKKFELTSTDLVNGVWAAIISTARGDHSSHELSWEPVEGAAEYIVYMVDMNSPDLVVCTFLHWKASGITVTELPEGWAPSTDYIGPNPGSGVTHIYEVYVVALKEPVERLKGSVRALNPKFKEFIQGLDTDSEGNTGNILAYGKISGTFTG